MDKKGLIFPTDQKDALSLLTPCLFDQVAIMLLLLVMMETVGQRSNTMRKLSNVSF